MRTPTVDLQVPSIRLPLWPHLKYSKRFLKHGNTLVSSLSGKGVRFSETKATVTTS